MTQDLSDPATGLDRLAREQVDERARAGRPVHALTLIAAMPVIGLLAALIVWLLGGSGWHIALAVPASWFLIQIIYAGQLAFYARRERHARKTVQRPEPGRFTIEETALPRSEPGRDPAGPESI